MSSEAAVLSTVRKGAIGASALGFAALGAGVAIDPVRAWTSLLVAAIMFLSIGLGGAVFLALNAVAKAGWHTVFRRVPEAFASFVPVGAVLMLLVTPGLRTLYLWARPGVMEHDHLLHLKHAYLNAPFFVVRLVVIVGLWSLFAWALRRNSLRQDATESIEPTEKNVALSAGFLVVAAITYCIASFDWLMSLEPHWFSTIYGLYNLAGMLASSVAALAIALVLLKRAGVLPQVRADHLHDLGRLMFGFATFWAYMWFSQFLLIWYANLPEETAWYALRWQGGWSGWFWAAFLTSWVLPFFLLLPRPAKRSEAHLLRVGALMLLGRWLDLYVLAAPSNQVQWQGIGLWELAGVLAVGGAFVLAVTRALGAAPVVPVHDPYLVESLHHHT